MQVPAIFQDSSCAHLFEIFMVSELRDPVADPLERREGDTEQLKRQLSTSFDAHRSILAGRGELSHAQPESVVEVLGRNPEYALYVMGQPGGESPLLALQSYAFEIIHRFEGVRAPDEEIMKTIDRLDQVKGEAEEINPDMRKIDAVLAAFIEERFHHLLATIDERIETAAQRIDRSWDDRRAEATRRGFPDAAAHAKHIRAQVPNTTVLREEIDSLMQDSRITYKARFLADTLKNFYRHLYALGLHGESNPFSPDDFGRPKITADSEEATDTKDAGTYY